MKEGKKGEKEGGGTPMYRLVFTMVNNMNARIDISVCLTMKI